MSSLRSRFPALDAATLASQHEPRADAGMGASLFALGASLSRDLAPAPVRPTHVPRDHVSYAYMNNPTPAMLRGYDAADKRGAAGD